MSFATYPTNDFTFVQVSLCTTSVSGRPPPSIPTDPTNPTEPIPKGAKAKKQEMVRSIAQLPDDQREMVFAKLEQECKGVKKGEKSLATLRKQVGKELARLDKERRQAFVDSTRQQVKDAVKEAKTREEILKVKAKHAATKDERKEILAKASDVKRRRKTLTRDGKKAVGASKRLGSSEHRIQDLEEKIQRERKKAEELRAATVVPVVEPDDGDTTDDSLAECAVEMPPSVQRLVREFSQVAEPAQAMTEEHFAVLADNNVSRSAFFEACARHRERTCEKTAVNQLIANIKAYPSDPALGEQ
jgi:hypothetical protein